MLMLMRAILRKSSEAELFTISRAAEHCAALSVLAIEGMGAGTGTLVARWKAAALIAFAVVPDGVCQEPA